MSTGRVQQVIGPVVDVEFPEDAELPKINNALKIDKGEDVEPLTIEATLELLSLIHI